MKLVRGALCDQRNGRPLWLMISRNSSRTQTVCCMFCVSTADFDKRSTAEVCKLSCKLT